MIGTKNAMMERMGYNLVRIAVLIALVLGTGSHAYARTQNMPVVRGQQMRDFVRLTFEWPQPTLFTAKTSGNNVILTFDRKANPNMGAVLKQLHPYIVKAEKRGDGKTIVLTLDKPHRVRTFVSDNISGIDLLDIKKGSSKQASALQPLIDSKKPEAKSTKKIAAKAKSEPKVAEAKKAKPAIKLASRKDDTADIARLAPAAGEEAAAASAGAVEEKQPAVALDSVKETEPVAENSATKEAEEVVTKAAPAAGDPVVQQTSADIPDKTPPTKETAQTAQDSSKKTPGTTNELPPAEMDTAKTAAAAEQKTAETVKPVAMTESTADTVKPVEEKTALSPEKEKPATQEVQATVSPVAKAAPEEKNISADVVDPSVTHGRDMGVSLVPMSSDIVAEEPVVKNGEPVAEAAPAESIEAASDQALLTSNKLVVSADADGATMRVPLKERVAMAVFIRMNSLWLVFDKKLDFDLSDFDELPQTIINKAVILPHDKATILRIPISDNIYPSIRQQEGQLDLAIILSTKKTPLDKAMDISISTDPPAPAHVFVPALEVGDTVAINDPDVGDTLLVTPLYTREQGITITRDFVDFSLLASTQGVVVAKKADETEITVLRNGLRIALPKGSNLSPQLSGAAIPEAKILQPTATGTLFPDDKWKLEENKSEKIAMNNLFNQTVFAPNEGAKNLARLRMAQIYLRNGFAVEALGMLDIINRVNPAYYRSAKLSAMHGAANFLMYRFNDAARDFSAAELNNNPEVAYWRDMLADLLGSPDKVNNFLAMNDSYISKYPPIFRQRLAIVAADRVIAAKEYNSALKIFDTLSKDNIIAPIQPYVDFLTAKISSENGQEAEAMEVWKRLAADSPNKFVQARASFSAILWQLDNNILTREQAMDKLERLRLGWHGDGLELQIVQLLGDLYFEKMDYVNAMRVWQIGVTGFKNTGPAIEMGHKMQDTFIKLFNEGGAEKMTPLEALALYYEYRAYTPTGATGTQMIEKLADRLVGVDLLSTAAQLLEQQMRSQMEKAERSRIGAKLAEVYLMNNQPKKAIKALQDSVYGDNPILQRLHRNQLTAQVMMQLKRPEEALSVLGQDESVNAEKLRAMIYWDQKDWQSMTTSIENMLKKREDPSAPLTPVEGEFVLRLALAYVYQNDAQQLQYMRDYFGPLMKDNPLKQAFDFITAPDINLTTRNFDDLLESLSKTRGFITKYKARVEMAEAQ